jgi:hypothetical protein
VFVSFLRHFVCLFCHFCKVSLGDGAREFYYAGQLLSHIRAEKKGRAPRGPSLFRAAYTQGQDPLWHVPKNKVGTSGRKTCPNFQRTEERFLPFCKNSHIFLV